MDNVYIASFIISIITASTPLLLAAAGELIVEKSGALNLGVEGIMLIGAIVGFAVALKTGSAELGVLLAAVAGMVFSMFFAVLVLNFLANQIASGLALAIFGKGFAALLGASFVGIAPPTLKPLPIPFLSQIPFFGRVLFNHNILIYFSFALVFAIHWFLSKTRAGLVLRAVGDNHDTAHAMGYPVKKIRLFAIGFGGAMAGVAGAYVSLFYSPLWSQDLIAGRGWIALALVVFAAWRPIWLLVGAYLFGGVTYLSLYLQGAGIGVPSAIVSMLPYIGTVMVLVMLSRNKRRVHLNQPGCLGKVFHAVS